MVDDIDNVPGALQIRLDLFEGSGKIVMVGRKRGDLPSHCTEVQTGDRVCRLVHIRQRLTSGQPDLLLRSAAHGIQIFLRGLQYIAQCLHWLSRQVPGRGDCLSKRTQAALREHCRLAHFRPPLLDHVAQRRSSGADLRFQRLEGPVQQIRQFLLQTPHQRLGLQL